MSYWTDKPKTTQTPKPWEQPDPQPMELDEEAMAELQEDPNVDIFEEEEDNTLEVMNDADLRLQQGRLYQLILKGDLFGETDADPKAIKNVQREIRKFVRERMETMLGIRQEQTAVAQVVSSPFNDMEVTALKMVASKVTKGASEQTEQPQQAPLQAPIVPKKDGITPINGNMRHNGGISPVAQTPKKEVKAAPKQQPKTQPKSAIKESESALQKPIDEMTPEELANHNRAAEERSKRNYAAMPTNMMPHPSPQQLEMLYTSAAINTTIANPWRTNAQ